MEYYIKKVPFEDIDKAFSLIWNTFLEFVAPDYGEEGTRTFQTNFIESDDFKNCFYTGRQIMFGAYEQQELIGVVSISDKNHISCVFVNKNFHRKGIATRLFTEMISELKQNKVEKIVLNASPYAVPFYHTLGFEDLDVQQNYHGILYIPMELLLKNV
jgi:predicted GNAT family N-acyltransferase